MILLILSLLILVTITQGIGLNYGLLGDNLPPPDQVVTLLKSKNIQKIRLFDPNPIVLNALGNSGIETVVGVPNQDLPELAGDYNFATQWVATNVIPYIPAVKFRYIAAGNEVIPGPLAQYVFDAMNHLDIALKKENINIPVTIVIHTAVIGPSFPPSNGVFSEVALSAMRLIIPFLVTNQYPLLYNPYPYFAYAGDPEHVPVSYALGNATGSEVVHDGDLQYNSLFDAMIDTIYAAAEKVGGEALRIVVAETGWPSARNGDKTTIPIAQAYVNNVIDRVNSQSGTPRKPGIPLEAYIYSIFNENQKPAGVEQNFGLFYPDMSPVYSVKLPV
ncbi:hypothetical protein K2173_026595 [Erythroxylum novogranatense]|uniref:glucan endo-1,3-beta-D-glucosidase n=1 Tax=Erythroxylum novogranatense TaxID=1862640 RepID=A0AAV8TX02_9ROSI|nr:hypothetical protein K2173_026595 [Erythroxylum novogranatense]